MKHMNLSNTGAATVTTEEGRAAIKEIAAIRARQASAKVATFSAKAPGDEEIARLEAIADQAVADGRAKII